MKTLRALALITVLACSAYAGDMQNDFVPPPPPPPPPTCSASVADIQNGDGLTGNMPNSGITGDIQNEIASVALETLLSLL